MFAADSGKKDVVELLIDKGADINAQDFMGNTALCLVTEKGHKEIEELLKEKGALVYEKTNNVDLKMSEDNRLLKMKVAKRFSDKIR